MGIFSTIFRSITAPATNLIIQVGYCTALITDSNPYQNVTLTESHYHPEFPHIVLPLPENTDIALKEWSKDTEEHFDRISTVISSLGRLQWGRHAVHFAHPFAHDSISGKAKFFTGGDDVLRHCALQFRK